jgi:polar amino acid transport system substrate-binding protein
MSAAKSESDLPLSFGKLLGYAGATLIAIILLAWVFLKLSKQENMLAGFGSRRFRSIVIAGLCFFVFVVASLGWFALTRIKSAVLQGVEQNLKRVLLISEEGLGVWEADRKAFMKQLGRDPELVRLVEELLMISPNPESLLTSKALEEVRDYFKNNKDIFSNIGFFIISPQDISIGSMRDSNVGTRNLIVDKYPGLIQKALDGQVNFVPAMESDVQLKKLSDSKQKRKPPTMFFIGPIQNSTGKTIAAMTLRVDPLKDFSRILGMLGRKGTEGTYAFDASGRLVTDTKFDTQLREIGLIDKDQTAALNLEIRDPGGNMLEGHHPASERSSLPLTRAAAGAIALKAGMEAAGATFGHSNIEVDISGYPDYRGVPVCGAWVWDKNLELGIAAEIGFDEALSNYFRVRFIILTVLGLTLVLFVCSTLFVLAMGERTHKSLTEAKDTLEDKVEERTAELKDKQEELQAAEERSRLILYSAGEGIFGVNTGGQINFINPTAISMLGFSEEEIVGQKAHALFHHSHADGSHYPVETCPMFKAFTDGTSHLVDDEVLWRKDGTFFPVEYSSTPMERDGRLVGAVITFRDITERKAAQERFEALLESAPDGMVVSDKTGNIVLVNSQAETIFGYSREELIGNNVDMLVPEEIRAAHPGKRASFYADPKRLSMGFRGDFYGVSKDGRKVPLDVGLSPIETEEGLLVVASVRDITERKKLEMTLANEREQLQLILDTSPVAIAISVDGILRFVNPRLTETMGRVVGDTAEQIYADPDARSKILQMMQKEGHVRNFETRIYDSQGVPRNMILTFDFFEYQGEKGLLAWAVDIDEMKRIQNELASAKEAAEKVALELQEKLEELTRFRRLAIGREHMMIELKKEINQQLAESGRPEKYKIH